MGGPMPSAPAPRAVELDRPRDSPRGPDGQARCGGPSRSTLARPVGQGSRSTEWTAKRRQRRMTMHRWLTTGAALAGATALLLAFTAVGADDAQDASQLVDKAKLTAGEFQKDPNMGAFRDLAK